MSLTPLLGKTINSSTAPFGENLSATILYLQDSTGAYNSATNAGGYGSPNYAAADIYDVIVRITLPGVAVPTTLLDVNSTTATIVLNSGTTPTAVQFVNPATTGTYPYSVTAITTAQSTTADNMNDGVYPFEYAVSKQHAANDNLYFVNGSKVVQNLGGAGTDLSDVLAGQYVRGVDGLLYLIDSLTYVGGMTDQWTININTEYQGADDNTATYLFYFYSLTNIALFQNANNCMLGIVGTEAINLGTDECDDCQTMTSKLGANAFNDFYTNIAGAESCGNLTNLDANLETYNTLYCGTNPAAGCGCS